MFIFIIWTKNVSLMFYFLLYHRAIASEGLWMVPQSSSRKPMMRVSFQWRWSTVWERRASWSWALATESNRSVFLMALHYGWRNDWIWLGVVLGCFLLKCFDLKEHVELQSTVSWISIMPLTTNGRARRVVGNISCVSAGNPSLHPVSDANSASLLRLTNPSFTMFRVCKIICINVDSEPWGCVAAFKCNFCNNLL